MTDWLTDWLIDDSVCHIPIPTINVHQKYGSHPGGGGGGGHSLFESQ